MHKSENFSLPVGLRATRPGYRTLRAGLLGTIAVTLLSTAIAQAQTADSGSAAAAPPPPANTTTSSLESVIVTGTRESGQKARDSSTPIVVISGAQLRQTGQTTLRGALEQLAPSISQPVYVANGAGYKDTISINGFSPNNVLVLVNGKRWHPSANIALAGGPQQGSTGVDLDNIPIGAIDHIEILQAGDSAQYGADAIAGVVNIILKSTAQGGFIETNLGQYYAGDGFSRQVDGNVGTSLGENGFLNLSAEYSGNDHTTRHYYDSRDDEYDVRDPNLPLVNQESLGANSGYYVNPDLKIYGFATYAHRTGDQFEDPRLASQLPKVYPNGFTPEQTLAETDYGATVGVKGDRSLLGWSWDLSSSWGSDSDDIGSFETANFSLYDALGYTPENFHLYTLTSNEWTNNLDLTRSVSVPVLPAPLTISWGGEFRKDFYDIGAGDPASYYGAGAQSLPGLAPQSAGDHSRTVSAGYLDLATRIAPKWNVDVAGRFEHYSDVGNTSTGQVTSRYDFTPQLALRGSVGTGFDAPSLAQEYISNVSVGPTQAYGILAADSTAAASIGARPLKPEQSTNLNLGAVLNPLPHLNATIDAYQIDIRDRIVTGGTVTGSTALAALAAAGFSVQSGLTANEVSTSYFTNGANTRTRGVNITGNYLADYGAYGSVNWNLSGNINDTELTGIETGSNGKPILNEEQQHWLTTATPKFKFIVGGNWLKDNWGLTLHENIYGPTTDYLEYFSGPNAYSATNFYGFHEPIKYTTDIALHYDPIPKLQLTVGALNLFNVYPNKVPSANQYLGVRYDTTSSQMGIFGGFYYVNARFTF